MTQGRKPGTLARFRCCICAEVELVTGGSKKFICSTCREAGHYVGHGKEVAGALVARAIRNGVLPSPRGRACADCGGPATEYDHRDYNKPLTVEPVCRGCNARRGPAIPKAGFFAEQFKRGHAPYRRRHAMVRIFAMLEIPADFSAVPKLTTVAHWEPFKAALLNSERMTPTHPAAPGAMLRGA